MNTWDVVILRFPFSDGKSDKVRPAIVVSKNEYHLEGDDALFMLITSNVERRALNDVLVSSDHPEFEATGLIKSSVIRVDKIMNLKHRGEVRRILGSLGPDLKNAVRAKLTELWKI